MGKSNGSTRASSAGSPRGINAGGYLSQYPSILSSRLPDGQDEGWYAVNNEIRAYLMTRDARNWGSTNEEWIIPNGRTIILDLQNNEGEDMFSVSFTYDGEGTLPNIYKTRRDAIKGMREYLQQRYGKK